MARMAESSPTGGDPIRSLAAHWPLLAFRGVCGVVFGCLALLWPGLALASLVLVFALYLVVDGLVALLSAAMAAGRQEPWVAMALEGVLSIAAAIVIFAMPGLTMLIALYIAGAWAVFSGVALLIASLRFGMGAWLMAFAAAASILLGGLLLLSPANGIVVIAVWLGIYALVFGSALLGLAWSLRSLSRERGTDETGTDERGTDLI